MKKKYSLKSKKDFNTLFKTGKKINSENLIFYFLEKNSEHIKIGIAISKKISKIALERNKLKRQIKSIITIIKPYDKEINLLIVIKRKEKKPSFSALQKEISWFFNQI